MSIGLPKEAAGGRNSPSLACTSGESSGTSTPFAWQASAHMIPGPPALVTIATRSPRGTGCLVSSAATSNSSWSVSVRITPACSNSASTVTSEADSSAPVCDEVARAPAARAAALDRQDRLLARDPRRDARELARVAERLEVQQRDVGLGVLLPVLQEVVARQVGLVADRDERRQAEAEPARRLDDRDPEAAALRQEADRSGDRRVRREGGVEPDVGVGVEHAEAVRPDQPDARVAADLEQLLLALDPLRAGLGEAGRDDEQRADAGRRALARDVDDAFGRARPRPRGRPARESR